MERAKYMKQKYLALDQFNSLIFAKVTAIKFVNGIVPMLVHAKTVWLVSGAIGIAAA